jgi:hypothetical protein
MHNKKKATKEHYVQQRYLKYFASNAEKNKIQIFDKVKKEVRCDQPIDRVASEGGFYDIDIDKLVIDEKIDPSIIDWFKSRVYGNFCDVPPPVGGDLRVAPGRTHRCAPTTEIPEDPFKSSLESNFTDAFLSNFVEPQFDFIEQLVSQVINKDRKLNSYMPLIQKGEPIREQISFYMTYQYLRTPAFRDHMYLINLISENLPLTENNPDLVKLKHSEFIFDKRAKEFQSTIESGIWILALTKGDKVFYTSDNPIYVLEDIDKKRGVFPDNIIQISYPLSPNLMLLIMSPLTSERLGYNEFENEITEPINSKVVDYFNRMRIAGAYRTVFCSKNQFENVVDFQNSIDGLSWKKQMFMFYQASNNSLRE